MNNYLQRLLAHKKEEVNMLKRREDLKQVEARASSKSFKRNLATGNAVIAEIKRRSPSKQHLATIADPVELAQRYAAGGAAAVSVLTDAYGFGGSIDDLKEVADALSSTSVATLRKDFIIDPLQINEAVFVGADAVLLIVAALKEKTAELLEHARQLNIDVLVEVMSLEELNYALTLSPELIAINNRDLTNFDVDPNRALNLRSHIPDSVVSVAASGMESPKVVSAYFTAGFNAVLVGEALVKAKDPSQFIRDCSDA